MNTYIALDIESTGFDPRNDQVIEVAAVKFQGDKIIDRFETLINPGVKIPPIITHITSIKESDVADAPTLESIKDKLEAFLEDFPIVGHNIDFDVNFLKAKGFKLINPLFDTLQLSMIMLPGLPSYSLDTLGRILKLEHENKHRAMSDTMACFKLFSILEQKIHDIDPRTLGEMKEILKRSTWNLKEIFLNVDGTKHSAPSKPETKDKKPAELISIDEAEILKTYAPGGKLSTIIPGYELRPNQQKMTEIILEALRLHKKKIIEAGTGMGKTLAYLMASIYWSLSHNERVVISTYTHNLQEQLIKKDAPILEQLFAPATFKIALVKGRRNYLSGKRFELLMGKETFLDHEVTLIVKIMLWLSHTTTGDLDELSIVGKEYSLLDEICCAEYACPHEDPEFKNACYLVRAREKAFNADIIVVNHALLLQDTVSDTPILPEHHHVIIDEAHHLEKVATDTLTIVLSFHSFQRPFEKMKKNLGYAMQEYREAATIDDLKTAKQEIDQLIGRIEIFFGMLGIFLEKNLSFDNFYGQLNLHAADLMSKEWLQAKDSGKNMIENGKELIEQLTKLHESVGKDNSKLWKEIKGYMYDCERKLHDLKSILDTEENSLEQMTWLSKSFEDNITIRRSPVDVGPTLETMLFSTKDSFILTSATLRADHSFQFTRDQLGLGPEFEETVLPSHFSYPDQVKILLPEDLPEPNSEGYFMSCANLIKNVIQKNGGRTLVLFTSKKALSATYHTIAPELKEKGFTVLAQQITGGRGKILEHFKDEPGTSAIFGTQSFWEGVDLQGNDLNCVIIQKLPFDPPDDPMIVARSKKYRDPFNQYQLPRAILKFKQGFGRLIRSSTDTGSIIVLDTRIIQKGYGQRFLEALPEGIKIEYGSKSNLQNLL